MKNGKIRLRFSLRTLLILVFLSAVALVSTQWYLRVRNSKPIEDVIATFNEKFLYKYKMQVSDPEPPLTSKQVFDYLNSDEEEITGAPPPVAAIFRQILTTKRISNDVQFGFGSYYRQRTGQLGECGGTAMMLIKYEEALYMITIREIKVHSFTPEP